MKQRSFYRLCLLCLVIIVAFYAYDAQEKAQIPDTDKSNSRTDQAPSDTSVITQSEKQHIQYTEEEIANFASDVIIPLISKARVSNPIGFVRNRVDLVFRLKSMNVINIIATVKPGNDNSVTMGASGLNRGKPTIVLMVPSFYYMRSANNLTGEELEDILAATIVHESIHLIEQSGLILLQISSPKLAHSIRWFRESDAWWRTIESCILPMRKRNRYTFLLPSDVKALEAYQAAGGDKSHPMWQDFVSSVTRTLPYGETE